MNKSGLVGGLTQNKNVAAQKKQLQGLKHQVDLLSRFLARLSQYYEGISPSIDKELKVLRGHLGGLSNFAMVELSIGKVTADILKERDTVARKNSKTSQLLESAIKRLQENQALANEVKDQASSYLVNLRKQQFTAFDTLPQFERAIELYNAALENIQKSKRPVIAATPPGQAANEASVQPMPAEQHNERLHQEIINELRELVGQLSLSNRKDKQLQEVKDLLLKGLTREELLECCLVIIKAIVRDVIQERENAEKFVSGLHSSLSLVNKTVSESLEKAETQHKLKETANDVLREKLAEIQLAVNQQEDIQKLKSQAAAHIRTMSAALENREQADAEEQLVLLNLLSEMKSQLTSLEKETAEYKHRLIEQKLLSHHDALTQLPNRTAYNERVEQEFKRWQRHGSSLSMALIDVDFFKKINDSYGHSAGDKTLQVIAQNINRCLRSTDFLARWGGEEFVVLLPQTTAKDLDKPIEAIRKQIARIPFKFKDKKVTITVSIGATEFGPDDTIESAFERADKALYAAKNSGRNLSVIQ